MTRRRPVAIVPALLLPAVLLAGLAYAGLFNWTHRTRPDSQVVIRGRLQEWSELQLRRNERTPRFTISGNPSDFRIDPSVFRDVMNGAIPGGLAPGAQIEITADAGQVASPLHPPLSPELSVIWVNGLAVDGHEQFSVADIVTHEKHQALWFIPLSGVALTLCCYFVFLGRRQIAAEPPTH